MPVQPDNMLYFHACPPLSDAELRVIGIDPRIAPPSARIRPNARNENVKPDGTGPIRDFPGGRENLPEE